MKMRRASESSVNDNHPHLLCVPRQYKAVRRAADQLLSSLTVTSRADRLDDEDQRNPLVVADALRVDARIGGDLLLRLFAKRDEGVEMLLWDDARHRQVVGVGDPADGVRVVDVTVGELGRAPAVDRPSDELLRADEERETDQDDDRVLTTQTRGTSSTPESRDSS